MPDRQSATVTLFEAFAWAVRFNLKRKLLITRCPIPVRDF